MSQAVPHADTELLAEQTALGDAGNHDIELENSQMIQRDKKPDKHLEEPIPHPHARKQETAQHEPAFLQRLMVKQESHAVSWSPGSESSSDWGDVAKHEAADGSAQPIQLQPSQHDSAAPAAPLHSEPSATSSQREQSDKALQPSKIRQEDQAQASKPSGTSGQSQHSDRSSKGPVPKRHLSAGALAASQGSAGSRKRKAGSSNTMVRRWLLHKHDLVFCLARVKELHNIQAPLP